MLILAFASHYVLDATPHFHIGWIGGHRSFEIIDAALGLILTGVIAWRVKQWWPLASAVVAVLPDLPGLRERWDTPFPHGMWAPPWGIAVEIVVTVGALTWALGAAPWTK